MIYKAKCAKSAFSTDIFVKQFWTDVIIVIMTKNRFEHTPKKHYTSGLMILCVGSDFFAYYLCGQRNREITVNYAIVK